MVLNWIGLGFVGLVMLYFGWQAFKFFTRVGPSKPGIPGLLVAQDTGKSKQIQSKTGDASMQTELQRRRTIQTVGRLNPSSIKETTHQKGSTTGAIETFFLSSICPPILAILENLIYDAGGACQEFCEVLDDTGSGPAYDAGGAPNTGCVPPLPIGIDYDAGGARDEYCDVLEDTGVGPGYDAGNSNAPSCVFPVYPIADYDAGNARDEFCNVLEDNGTGEELDAGTSNVTSCLVPVPRILGYDAGEASNEYCDVLDDKGTGPGYDAGDANTRVCGN